MVQMKILIGSGLGQNNLLIFCHVVQSTNLSKNDPHELNKPLIIIIGIHQNKINKRLDWLAWQGNGW
jgi:hypothetical protein